MSDRDLSRRSFIASSSAMGILALREPAKAAAQAVGIKPADLPDLTIKEVKVYATDLQGQRVLNGETGRIASIVTNSGIEGNYTLLNSIWHTGWNLRGWLDYAKSTLPGKNVLNLSGITSQWDNRKGQVVPYMCVIDCCLWDILGKAVDLPIYKILGGYRDKVMAYASSAHLANIEAYEADVLTAKKGGYRAYKVHPGSGRRADGTPISKADGHIEILKLVKKTAGEGVALLHDPVQGYTREEALKVGKVLDELGYVAYEDPLPTKDIDGLVELCKAVDTPVHVGEFMPSMYAYPEYIRRGAMDVVRLICDNCGGITGAMKVAAMAECFGMEVHPHNWGEAMEVASHFHVELASPNAKWFEMPHPSTGQDRLYHKDKIRIDKDGYVSAPTAPGLGYPLDRDMMDKLMIRIER